MGYVRIAAIVLLGSVFTGCASVRVYPVCFYDKKPDSVKLDKAIISGLLNSFAAVSLIEPSNIVISPDVRWIIARTTEEQDSNLLRIWPRVGCIGPGRSTSQVKLQIDCIAYVEDFIKERRYTVLGEYTGISGNKYYNESRDPKNLVYCASDS